MLDCEFKNKRGGVPYYKRYRDYRNVIEYHLVLLRTYLTMSSQNVTLLRADIKSYG